MKSKKFIASILSITMLLGGTAKLSFANDDKGIKKIALEVHTDSPWPDGTTSHEKKLLLNYNQLPKSDKDKILEVFKNLQKKNDDEKAKKMKEEILANMKKEILAKIKNFIKGAAQCCAAAGLIALFGVSAYYTSTFIVD